MDAFLRKHFWRTLWTVPNYKTCQWLVDCSVSGWPSYQEVWGPALATTNNNNSNSNSSSSSRINDHSGGGVDPRLLLDSDRLRHRQLHRHLDSLRWGTVVTSFLVVFWPNFYRLFSKLMWGPHSSDVSKMIGTGDIWIYIWAPAGALMEIGT